MTSANAAPERKLGGGKAFFAGVADGVLSATAFLSITLPAYAAGALLRRVRNRPLRKGNIDLDGLTSILVVRVDGLGDVVLLSGFLKSLRASFPAGWITLVVDEKVAAYVELCPWVDEVLGFNEQGTKYQRLLRGSLRAWQFARLRLHRRNFDLAINPRWDIDSRAAAFLGYFSLAHQHVGFSESVTKRKSRLNCGSNRLLSSVISGTPATVHETQRYSEVLAALGVNTCVSAPEQWVNSHDLGWAEDILHDYQTGGSEYLVCFGIGGVELKRLWPMANFQAIAGWLIAHKNASVVIIGDARDRAAAEPLANAFGRKLINVAGICSLRRSAALLSYCDLFVGNDSGPMHMASAAGVPVVEISCHPADGRPGHINSPLRYMPLGVASRILQPRTARFPCRDGGCQATEAHCIQEIHPVDVQNAISELLTKPAVRGLQALSNSAERMRRPAPQAVR